jgi:hypothetical protein
MFDPSFLKMQLVMSLGHENVFVVVAEYDEKLLLFILMEANKLLMLIGLKSLLIFIHKWILKVYFTSHVESCKCVSERKTHVFNYCFSS